MFNPELLAAFAECLMELTGYSNHEDDPGRQSCTTNHGLISVMSPKGYALHTLGLCGGLPTATKLHHSRAKTPGNHDINFGLPRAIEYCVRSLSWS